MGVALITGASAGFGIEFAKLFARDGHSLVLVARRLDRLEALARELREAHPQIQVWPLSVDLGSRGAVEALHAKVKDLRLHIDFLVNNAGLGRGGAFLELPLADQLQMMDVNNRALVELTHLLGVEMCARKSGKILNVGSTAGFQPGPYMAIYYASKAFVNSFSEALHQELKGTGVTCTLLAPGAAQTEFAQVAGLEKSKLFQSVPKVAAAAVVEKGYLAMMEGRAIEIPGVLNRIFLQSLRISPRAMVRQTVAKLNKAAKS